MSSSYPIDKLQHFCLVACEKIRLPLEEHILRSVDENNSLNYEEDDSIFKCEPPVVELLTRQARVACARCGDWALHQRRLEDLLSLANGKFYAYPFKDVPECWRRLFTDASILKACSLVVQGTWVNTRPTVTSVAPLSIHIVIDIMVRTLDLAVIMAGAPGPERQELIEGIMDLLEPMCESSHGGERSRPAKRRKFDGIFVHDSFTSSSVFVPQVHHPAARKATPSLRAFEKHMQSPGNPNVGPEPLIIENILEHWPACHERPWKRPSYLMSKTLNGRRLVPVEVGRSYVDNGWGQKIITFKDFMQDYLLGIPSLSSEQHAKSLSEDKQSDCDGEEDARAADRGTGYLAQHDLFTQIPSLRADICIPDYCYTSPPPPHPSSPLASKHRATPQLEVPLLNAWFGPAGTISPMHVDPYHNILAQVVGRKYIRLYAPCESEKLYPRGIEEGGVNMGNTSAVDIGVLEGWDGTKADQEEAAAKYPLYKEAVYVDLILDEGECLYIPVGWWHYVRSLSVSFSVSFWWN